MGVLGFQVGGLSQPHPINLPFPEPRAPAVPLESAGITVGELVGWRIWRVRTREKLLVSYSADAIWLPGEPMEGKPSDRGHHGVWAFKDARRALAKIINERFWGAMGTVWLWGDYVEHSIGYRAQFAEVRSIDRFFVTDSTDDEASVLAALRARYGVGDDQAATAPG